MDGDSKTFASAQERTNALHDAEAASRKAESEAAVLRGRTARARDPESYKTALQEKIDAGTAAQKELDEINSSTAQQDLSGVSRGLTDSAGNFAANVDVLKAGGIGVEASNTNVETGEPAKSADEAGARGTVAIPEDWQKLPVGERRALVARLGGSEGMKSADANDFIQAEVDRRKTAE